jgi:hypothetical protein
MAAGKRSLPTRIVEKFLDGNLSVILIVLALLAGAAALLLTPREEEPQIVVPLADVYVQMPGARAEEVENQVATRLEKLLWPGRRGRIRLFHVAPGPGGGDGALLRRRGSGRLAGQAAQQDPDQPRPGPARGYRLGSQAGRSG